MTIEAKINKDSVGPNGVRITTFILRYPRFIHSELMTHRAFSRNASSSRAIPFEKQMKLIAEDPAIPLEFRKNQKGMQAGEALDDEKQASAVEYWHKAKEEALYWASLLVDLGVHKQYVNRLVEPFAHISVVLTATEFANFFALRHHSMAQPEIAELARQMWELYSTNTPQKLERGEWHLPFVSKEEIEKEYEYWEPPVTGGAVIDIMPLPTVNWPKLIKMSVARCARVSFLNHDGTQSSYEQDCALYDRLLAEQPIHSSPAEHQARPLEDRDPYSSSFIGYELDGAAIYARFSGNFRQWFQYRQGLKGQNILQFKESLG